MALEFNCHDLVNIYSSTRTKQDFIEACIKEYLVESERWGIYWSLIDAAWDCATDNSEEKQNDQPTNDTTPLPAVATPSGEIKPRCISCNYVPQGCNLVKGSEECIKKYLTA